MKNQLPALKAAQLDLLMPLHVEISTRGHITHAGPTLQQLCKDRMLVGHRFLEIFQMRRPATMTQMAHLAAVTGKPLKLQLRDDPQTAFKGVAVPFCDGGGYLVNLSFGIGVADVVRDHGLTGGDFAATDLAVELLYLSEAKTAVMEALKQLNTRLNGAKIAAEEQALTDTLTGLKNRREMDQVLAQYAGSGQKFGLMNIDLDFFKDVNDSQGHAAGDHVLQAVAAILVEETRTGDTVIRAGGDEFVIVFPDLVLAEQLNEIALRIIKKLEQPIRFEGAQCRVSASVGTTTSELYERPEPDQMLADADAALYISKRKGRARTTMFSNQDDIISPDQLGRQF